MKKYILVLSLVFTTIFAKAQIIDNQLFEELSHRSDDEKIEVIVVMKARYDRDVLNQKAASYLNRAERRAFVVNELKSFAELSQKDLMEYLGGDAKSLWASNSLYFSATKSQVMEIANRNDVEIIGLNKAQQLIPVCDASHASALSCVPGEITPNLTQTNVPEVWAQGYTGEGVIVAVVDSGVNYDHQDIADHLWDGGDEFPHHGYDYVNGDDDPMDDMGHGTHCAGTVCGDGTAGSQTGVAPDATLMCI
ncbi:MAG: S8 family serine peptidase, partial [Bacteroidales bacterium]|nr:S8 family serine peptidase [Bacteroidales bacterium]